MTAVAIYARYSSDQQRDASIEDQIRLCEERATKEGWHVHNHYTDHGVSGASLMRPGIQQLIQDALAGKFQIILAEALDRLSRDQEDIAGIYKRMSFAGVKIVTLSEGEISDLHIGLKGTMNALYLKDLADKTRRGLRGRVEAGKSGGGNSYGYNVIKSIGEDGEPVRGERRINKGQAAVIRHIFNAYANGSSPKAIARQLNKDNVPGPSGKDWGQSTINGNRERGTGILNNELYIGRLVWNRLRYIKDPDTGKRVSRLNPESAWIVQDVPDLRIIDQDLWDKVKARQSALDLAPRDKTGEGFWDRRRPRYLFSGLIKCGSCGGGFVKISAEHLGCANARNKGTCDNRRTIKRERLERIVLHGLKDHLMDPALCAIFAEEYTAHMNRLRMDESARLEGYRAERRKADAELDRLVQAIADGVPGAKLKDRIARLERRKTELSALLAETTETPIRIHPGMAAYYREQVTALHDALGDEERRAEAVQIIRTLVDHIVLTPNESEPGGHEIDLHGALAGILSLASDSKKAAPAAENDLSQMKLVAGARNRRYQQGLFQAAA